jgi:hypothetical protein
VSAGLFTPGRAAMALPDRWGWVVDEAGQHAQTSVNIRMSAQS